MNDTGVIQHATDGDMLVVGRDVDGKWTVRESAGMLLGRFGDAAAANRFVERERRSHPGVAVPTSLGVRSRLCGTLSLAMGKRSA